MRAALVQMNSTSDKSRNLETAEKLIREAATGGGPNLVMTPECTTFLGGTRDDMWEASEPLPEGESYRLFSSLARDLDIHLHIGSLLERVGDIMHNTAVVFAPDGSEISRYRKIHMFDIVTPSGQVFRESEQVAPGRTIETYELDGRKIGVTICYDIRFAELFLELAHRKADVIAIPAAFNAETGQAHWEALCRARAIETQTYVLAPGQIGAHMAPDGPSECFGNSLIVDPWGSVIARASDTECAIWADLDFDYLETVRARIPVATHRVLQGARS